MIRKEIQHIPDILLCVIRDYVLSLLLGKAAEVRLCGMYVCMHVHMYVF